MDLNDLPNGASVFIDANIFVYHFSGVSIECRTLFERIERKEVQATTGAHILLESLHRLMMIEAVSKGLIWSNDQRLSNRGNDAQLWHYQSRLTRF